MPALEVGKNRMEALGEAQETADLIRYSCERVQANDGYVRAMARDPVAGFASENASAMKPRVPWLAAPVHRRDVGKNATIEAGVAYANRRQGTTTGAWPGHQPFGGWKDSGSTGKSAGSLYYLTQYLREQSQTRVRRL